jgi:outer membrane protein OmpA-like peptidoglycan-associated protein
MDNATGRMRWRISGDRLMKIARSAKLALFVHALSWPMAALVPAAAADWDSDTVRLLGDPSFLPLAGQIEGSFSSTYSVDRYDSTNNNFFATSASYRRSGLAFLPALNYGITDDISVFAQMGWGNSFNREDYTEQRLIFGIPLRIVPVKGTVTYHALGADDPVFGATWRAIDQRNAPVSVDITGSYAPDIFRSKAPTDLDTGSLADGGQSGSVQVAISREMELLTVRAYGAFDYEGRRNESTDSGFEDLRSAPHAAYTAGLQTELRLLPWLALHAGITAQQAMQYDRPTIDQFGVTPVTIKPSGTISPYGGVLLPFFDRHLTAEVMYQHDFIDNEFVQSPYETNRYYKQENDQITGRLRFVFGGAAAPTPAPASAPLATPAPGPQEARTYLLFFDWDRADLSARARQIVAEAAQASAHTQTTRIEVNGYTDLSGTRAYNQALSLRRARSVEAELVRDGVTPTAIAIQGYGESNPLVPTAIGVREPQNRRVEIILK